MVSLWKLHVKANDNVLIHSKSTCANHLSDLKTKSLLAAKGVDFFKDSRTQLCERRIEHGYLGHKVPGYCIQRKLVTKVTHAGLYMQSLCFCNSGAPQQIINK